LITDDDPFNHLALEGLFMMKNIFGIDKAFNGQEGLNKLTAPHACLDPNHVPHKLIILDNNMPVLTGIPTAKRIRALQKEGKISPDLKLVLFSGDDFTNMNLSEMEPDIKQPKHVTTLFDYILAKPVTKTAFEALL